MVGRGVPSAGEERTVPAVIERRSRLTPDKPAVRDASGSLTYAQLRHATQSVACGLQKLGVGRSDRVAVMLDNHIDYAVTGLGVSLGAVEVPINTAYKGRMLQYVLAHSGARVAIVEDRYVRFVVDVADQTPCLEVLVIRGADYGALPPDLRSIPFEDLPVSPSEAFELPQPWDQAAIMYTSGTTGPSKGVIVPHGLAYGSSSIYPPTLSDDVVMVPLPLFHIGGRWADCYNAWIAGAEAVIFPQFSASSFWGDVRKYGCTSTLIMGVMGDFLMNQPATSDDRHHPLRMVAMTPVIPRIEEFITRFGVEVWTGYGLTEAGTIFTGKFNDIRPKSAGWIRPDFEARVVDELDREVPLGTAGELIVRAREPWSILGGYHGMPQETLLAFRNLWFHTGDAMSCDESGQFYFIDRIKDAVRRRGENISSFEVEAYIAEAPGVAEVAVVAVPSVHTEDEIKAVITLKSGAAIDMEELVAYLVDRMPYFMVPRYYEIIDEFPMTATLKVRKEVLRAAGITEETWDCEQAGLRVTRHGLKRFVDHPAI